MARRVVRPYLVAAERDDLIRGIEHVGRRQSLDAEPEHRALLHRALVQKEIVAVQIDRHAERTLGDPNAGHVIDVGVRQEDVPDRERVALGEGEQAGDFVAGIDQHGVTRLVAADDEAVLEERSDGLCFDYDHAVILAILDDLMFSSKIKTAASQLGVAVTFARSSDAALVEMRRSAPSLVILDLNNPRTDPLGTVGAMKSDPALASIPTVGFASHVQTDVIDAARQAGVDEVLARSAFTTRLGEILTRRTS